VRPRPCWGGLLMSWAPGLDVLAIIWLDILLSGDNALIIGLAASSLSRDLRRTAIIFGLLAAATIRILFACTASYLMSVPGLLFLGGMALLWVSYRLYGEIREHVPEHARSALEEDGYGGPPRRTLAQALISITVADISMSIDNVLAVAAIARDNIVLLVFGLGLSIAMMGLCATMIMRLLVRFRWISYLGVLFLVFVAGQMLWEGRTDALHIIGVGKGYMGLLAGIGDLQ